MWEFCIGRESRVDDGRKGASAEERRKAGATVAKQTEAKGRAATRAERSMPTTANARAGRRRRVCEELAPLSGATRGAPGNATEANAGGSMAAGSSTAAAGCRREGPATLFERSEPFAGWTKRRSLGGETEEPPMAVWRRCGEEM